MEGKKDNFEDFGVYSAKFASLLIDEEVEEKKIKNNVVAEEETKNNVVAEEETKNNVVTETEKIDFGSEKTKHLRSLICCVIGHAYSGKTKLIECLKQVTNFNDSYSPTQQIHATNVDFNYTPRTKVPGVIFLDTPGLISFTESRSQGLALCDIAILVVDIMVGLQPQTVESLYLLQMWNTKFVIVLSKFDSIIGWTPCPGVTFREELEQQSMRVQHQTSLLKIETQFRRHGVETKLFCYKQKAEHVTIIPTSAISGERVLQLLYLLVKLAQNTMVQKLTYREELQCTVLNAKHIEGYGSTIDVVLVNGTLRVGDRIVAHGSKGPIVTSIQVLWSLRRPVKELGGEGNSIQYINVRGAKAIRITAKGLEDAVPGTDLYVMKPDNDSKDVEETTLEDEKQHL